MTWQDLDATAFAGDTAPIVPIEMNSSSGTYNTFKGFIGVDPDTAGTCSIALGGTHGGTLPLENDVKPIFQSITSGFGTGDLDPENWLWWGSFGVFSAFPFTSSITATQNSTFYQAVAAKVAPNDTSPGVLPSTSLTSTYPIQRILWQVTRKGDADCPATLVGSARSCDFANQAGPIAFAAVSGPTDLNVTGGVGGPSGAVREFTRWLCRASAAVQGNNPYTGTNDFLGITGVINSNGFTVVPTAQRSSGSRCDVVT